MKYFFVVGEASGDLHASNLIKSIKQQDAQAQFEAWGGDLMQAQGVTIHKHITDLAFMGFKQVIMNLPIILSNFKLIKEQIEQYQPDAVVLVDYPGFNLRLANWLHAKSIKTIYYIMPQAWAWKEKRVKKIKAFTDLNICILPFEKDFFEGHGIDIHYVGHPILEAINFKPNRENIIAILPGSRKQEIQSMLPTMLEVKDEFPNYKLSILKSPNVPSAFYQSFLNERVVLEENGAAAILNKAKAALVTSGTATLETACYEVPQAVCYKTGGLTYLIAKQLINIKYISLVNLIKDAPLIPELIQVDFNKEKLVLALDKALSNEEYRGNLINEYQQIKRALGEGTASTKAAEVITDYLKNIL